MFLSQRTDVKTGLKKRIIDQNVNKNVRGIRQYFF